MVRLRLPIVTASNPSRGAVLPVVPVPPLVLFLLVLQREHGVARLVVGREGAGVHQQAAVAHRLLVTSMIAN